MIASLREPPESNMVASLAPAVRIRGVTCTFAGVRRNQAYTAIRDADLSVAEGEFLSIVGPTGCGKSTLLNVVAGLIAPTRGQVDVFGAPLSGLNRDASYLFQGDALLPWKTAIENVTLGPQSRGDPASEVRERALRWLARVGLAPFRDRYPHQLSGGQRKRVAIAQTLIMDPKILLMDEPFSALDVQTRQIMENELLALWTADRKSVIFVTHDLEEAISLSDRIVLLSAGPGSRLIGEYAVDLPRPRDVAEIRLTPGFLDIYRRIWADLKGEVQKSYEQQMTALA